MKQILISGYYGFGNSGDDALLLSIIKDFEGEGLKNRIVVLSKNPEETELSYGVKAVSRTNPFAVLISIIKARLFVSGGGTLIQDGTSTKSLIYYLSLICAAKLLGKKVMLYANGIGPVVKSANRRRCRRILNRVDAITVRDEKSLEELCALGVSRPRIVLTADPVFSLKPDVKKDEIFDKYGIRSNVLCVAVRSPKERHEDFVAALAGAIDKASSKYGMRTALLPMQNIDYEISESIKENMKTECIILREKLSPEQMLAMVSHFEMCIGMRLHMLIYAAAVGVPIVGIVYDPKVSGFMEYAGQKLYVDLRDVTEDKLFELICRCMADKDVLRAELSEVRKKLSKLSKENMNVAKSLYSETKGD